MSGRIDLHVLLVEDQESDAVVTRAALGDEGPVHFDVDHAVDLSNALEAVEAEPYDCVVLDLDLPDSKDLDTAKRMLDAARVPVVVHSGDDRLASALTAITMGVEDYVVKGPHRDRLGRAVLFAVLRHQALSADLPRGRRA